ncbi:hypothetical protein Y032_0475g2126 [Ancylostoma ceylanicum]|uniref:Uncharacterized protein n=1 Tax=Ancylostoma ceylanicum TaxID=53326 RepID=A0A016WW10_9BILA|nr:hypothetical protein Y032_0475g2126 [Ancylostoma ceylanicum]
MHLRFQADCPWIFAASQPRWSSSGSTEQPLLCRLSSEFLSGECTLLLTNSLSRSGDTILDAQFSSFTAVFV